MKPQTKILIIPGIIGLLAAGADYGPLFENQLTGSTIGLCLFIGSFALGAFFELN